MAMYVVNTGATPLSRGDTIKNALEYTRGKDGFAKPAGTASRDSLQESRTIQSMLTAGSKPADDASQGSKGTNIDVSV